MKRILLITTLLSSTLLLNAQLEIAKLVGKDSKDFKLGYGGFLKFGYPVSQASDVNLEVGALIFFDKDGSGDGMGFVPVKLGYRYTLNGSGEGLYVEPQLGYNVAGVRYDEKIPGFIWSAGTGFLFSPAGGIQFDLGVRYESLIYKGGTANYFGFRLTHNFLFRKREE